MLFIGFEIIELVTKTDFSHHLVLKFRNNDTKEKNHSRLSFDIQEEISMAGELLW